jgi:uncharacterized membrane protein SpoIIM required for sporulation
MPYDPWLTPAILPERPPRVCAVDIDAYIAAHQGEWDRLDTLLRRNRLTGAEADEFVDLYQRAATHLSVVRSQAPDPALVGHLSSLVARARSDVTGSAAPRWRDATRFLVATFPAAVWRSRWWAISVAAAFVLVSVALGWWVATHEAVQASIATPEQIRQLVDHDFASYYSDHAASAFAFEVWTNNAWIAALCITLGGFFGLPVIFLQFQNALNVGAAGGLMAAHGKLGLFFGLILPHGLLELTAVWVAGGVGLRLGWTLIDPGPRRRGEAFAAEGRAAMVVALGLILVLLVSGVIEAFVTPSGLPTWARIAIGLCAWSAFVAWIAVLGRRAAQAGVTGDLDEELRGAVLPSVG